MGLLIFITIGAAGIVGALVLAFGSNIADAAQQFYTTFGLRVTRSYLPFDAARVLLIGGIAAALLVGIIIALFRPPLLADIVLVLFGGLGAYGAVNLFLKVTLAKRQAAFTPQLEQVLRMLSSSLSVGLGLRQAVVLVTEDVVDPARSEFLRIIGRTNIGISILDAIDEMAERMPSSEMSMTARAIRVQSQTGGDLAKVLENVATTIQARRTLMAKMAALTAEGRISGIVILALPFAVGGFIAIAQPAMGHAMFFTLIGQASLAGALLLELAAGFSLKQIMRFDP
ncbi:MAG TPA: type II secretion system F family protein [Candidatus Baltobacteraceae bacterium]|nr:type II secretion system F family protein [Candidatus Baltobacteraceae bacterium]